jgi:hypothetical protein
MVCQERVYRLKGTLIKARSFIEGSTTLVASNSLIWNIVAMNFAHSLMLMNWRSFHQVCLIGKPSFEVSLKVVSINIKVAE